MLIGGSNVMLSLWPKTIQTTYIHPSVTPDAALEGRKNTDVLLNVLSSQHLGFSSADDAERRPVVWVIRDINEEGCERASDLPITLSAKLTCLGTGWGGSSECMWTTAGCNGKRSHYYLISQTNGVPQKATRPRQSVCSSLKAPLRGRNTLELAFMFWQTCRNLVKVLLTIDFGGSGTTVTNS